MPCNNCPECIREDCGACKFCLDKKKFGGPARLKKRCELRVCSSTPTRKGGLQPRSVSPKMTRRPSPTVSPAPKTPRVPNMRERLLTTLAEKQRRLSYSQNSKEYSEANQIETSAPIENIIHMGLDGSYDVVNVTDSPNGQSPCYVCNGDNGQDLFYCSHCCHLFHQSCLSHHTKTVTKFGRCVGGTGDYEQVMMATAESFEYCSDQIEGVDHQILSNQPEPSLKTTSETKFQSEDEEVPWLKPSVVKENDIGAYFSTFAADLPPCIS